MMQTTTRYIHGSPVTLPHLRCIAGEYIPPAPARQRGVTRQAVHAAVKRLRAKGVA